MVLYEVVLSHYFSAFASLTLLTRAGISALLAAINGRTAVLAIASMCRCSCAASLWQGLVGLSPEHDYSSHSSDKARVN